MKYTKPVCLFLSLVLLIGANRSALGAAVGTAFTFQGQLQDGSEAANGNYDLAFALFDAADFGTQVGSTVTNLNVAVINGIFTTEIDFGTGIFGGTAYWLAIGVRSNGSGAGFSLLSPRQPLNPTPYALYAGTAAIADESITGLQIQNGTISSADLAPNSVNSGHIINLEVANADLANNAVTTGKILDGTILGADMAPNTVTSIQLADDLDLGSAAVGGRLDLYRISNGAPAISLVGNATGGYQYLYQYDGDIGIYLDGDSGGAGLQYLYAADGALGVVLDGDSGGAGLISIRNTNGSTRINLDGSGTGTGGEVSIYAQDGSTTIQLQGEGSGAAGLINLNNNVGQTRLALDGEGNGLGGQINLYAGDGGNGIILYGDSGGGGLQYLYAADGSIGVMLDGESGGAGYISVRNTNSSSRIILDGSSSNFGGEVAVYDTSGTETIELLGAFSTTLGGVMRARQGDGTIGVEINSETYSGDGGDISVNNAAGNERLELDGDDGDGGAVIRLRNGAGTTTITLDGDVAGDGRITTQELSITGGSDLSEKFDIHPASGAIVPGALVCIDPQNPGKLKLSSSAYDRAVAGVISGAGGVKTGMMMGQAGSLADGEHPVALTGRVFCMVDAGAGAIQPGDLITTSNVPGHGMKVTDYARAQGAIIGKAMTGLDKGKGLVLVLVSLQ